MLSNTATVVYLLIPTSNHNTDVTLYLRARVVYLLIPTSNHNGCSAGHRGRTLYIFWFLHQTTTVWLKINGKFRCISFDSYIKPQRWNTIVYAASVVYLLIPTSNHNSVYWGLTAYSVVYLLIPTSNHNIGKQHHNSRTVVYLLIPTSNHNTLFHSFLIVRLYIFWFLHQTTTWTHSNSKYTSCISFDSYIKPQHYQNGEQNQESCISFDSYIKPQPTTLMASRILVVYLLIPTSNHNFPPLSLTPLVVVYLLIPTSNHNCLRWYKRTAFVVYLLIPTSNHNHFHSYLHPMQVVYLLIPTSNHNAYG